MQYYEAFQSKDEWYQEAAFCLAPNLVYHLSGLSRDLERMSLVRKTLAILFLILLVAIPAAWSDASTAPAFYYTYKSSSVSDYIPEFDITLDSNTYNLMQDFPAANILNQIDWASSHSYAKSYIVAKTSGDRLFRLRSSGTGALDVKEYDPNTLQATGVNAFIGDADLFDYTSVISVEISGDYVYWLNYEDGTEFYNLATTNRDFLNVSCRKIVASATNVFCITVSDESETITGGGDYIEFFEIDRATGDLLYNHGRWYFGSNNSSITSWGFAADGAVVYAIRPDGNNNTELWKFDTGAFLLTGTEIPTLQFRKNINGSPTYIDADGGFLMLPLYGNGIMIYDTLNDSSETIIRTLDGGARYPEFIMQNVPEASSPDPTPDTGGGTVESDGGGGGGGCFIFSILK